MPQLHHRIKPSEAVRLQILCSEHNLLNLLSQPDKFSRSSVLQLPLLEVAYSAKLNRLKNSARINLLNSLDSHRRTLFSPDRQQQLQLCRHPDCLDLHLSLSNSKFSLNLNLNLKPKKKPRSQPRLRTMSLFLIPPPRKTSSWLTFTTSSDLI